MATPGGSGWVAPSPPPPPPWPPGRCFNTCQYSGDGACDDGGLGSLTSSCDSSTDCDDCGSRLWPPPSPPPSLPVPPSPPPLPPALPAPPRPPPLSPILRETFSFDDGPTTLGFSTGLTDTRTGAALGPAPYYGFARWQGQTPTGAQPPARATGPPWAVGGAQVGGHFYYAESSEPREAGDIFRLAYNGSFCLSAGLLVGPISFFYHMHGVDQDLLRVVVPADADQPEEVWSVRGPQGSDGGPDGDGWLQARDVFVHHRSFAFEVTRGGGYLGECRAPRRHPKHTA